MGLLTALLGASPSDAKPLKPPQIGPFVRMPLGPIGPPTAETTWNSRSVRARYGAYRGWAYWLTSPFSWAIRPAALAWGHNFPNRWARDVANYCKTGYPDDAWLQLRCAAEVLERWERDNFSGNWSRFPRTPCQSQARAFTEVLRELRLPQVRVGWTEIDFHILNTIQFVGSDGVEYKYVFDPGWDPNRVWPMNDAAKRYHDPDGDGDCRTTGSEWGTPRAVPAIPMAPVPDPSAQRIAAVSQGSNVHRLASTRGSESAIGSSSVTQSAGAAR